MDKKKFRKIPSDPRVDEYILCLCGTIVAAMGEVVDGVQAKAKLGVWMITS
jgi:hypothetical protein